MLKGAFPAPLAPMMQVSSPGLSDRGSGKSLTVYHSDSNSNIGKMMPYSLGSLRHEVQGPERSMRRSSSIWIVGHSRAFIFASSGHPVPKLNPVDRIIGARNEELARVPTFACVYAAVGKQMEMQTVGGCKEPAGAVAAERWILITRPKRPARNGLCAALGAKLPAGQMIFEPPNSGQ